MEKLSHTFGEQSVDPTERERLIRRVFSRVATRYDLMNDLMSMGIHRLWKRRFARAAAPRPGQTIVDLAGGTGDIAALLAAHDRTVIVCDPSREMMGVGRDRGLPSVRWLAGVGEAIPIADGTVDTVTIAFGIRNVTHMGTALAEVLRVLRPGGRFLCLEFSKAAPPIRPFYELFNRTVIPRLGAWVSRNPEAYRYLIESIQKFPDQHEMQAILVEAGFVDVRWRNQSFGIACVHEGTKPFRAASA
jgi:demethylmenaquinone methyltransferase/2-methoxy-6-polyprenyl-1,4-benzoquinol methylase